jgi:hypothetical protein
MHNKIVYSNVSIVINTNNYYCYYLRGRTFPACAAIS